MTKILIVDDEAMNRMLMSILLSLKSGYSVDEAENGKVALERIQEKEYDVIMMDINMPVMNGLETTKYIREHISKSLPIIAVTANDIRFFEKEYSEVGFTKLIQKPINKIVLIDLIEELVNKK